MEKYFITGCTILLLSAVGMVLVSYWMLNTVDQLFVMFGAERKDMLDRLMAGDLAEVKQAQAIERRKPNKVMSKSKNTDLITAENMKTDTHI